MEPHQEVILLTYIVGVIVATLILRYLPKVRHFIHRGDTYHGEEYCTNAIFIFVWPIVFMFGTGYLIMKGLHAFVSYEKPKVVKPKQKEKLKRKIDGVRR